MKSLFRGIQLVTLLVLLSTAGCNSAPKADIPIVVDTVTSVDTLISDTSGDCILNDSIGCKIVK